MLLAAAAMTWILTTYDGSQVTSVQPYQTEQECEAAREAYLDQFTDHWVRLRHPAKCSYPPADSME
ncbi:MAG: hypothetical protein ACHQAX_05005 [Gammaproteobacteria bacterium]